MDDREFAKESGEGVRTLEPVMGRREFTAASVMALLSGVAITLSGCSGGGSGSPSAPSQTPAADGSRTASISANHGHTAVLTGAVLTAGNAVNLNIQGSSDHPHSVSLSASEVQQIGSGQRVSKSSSADAGHEHTVTFN